MIEHRQLIEKFGGPRALTAALSGMTDAEWEYETVRKWARRGIPWHVRPLIARLAAERGIRVPEGFLDSTAAPLPDTTHETPPTPASAPAGMPGRQLREQPCKHATADDIGQCHG